MFTGATPINGGAIALKNVKTIQTVAEKHANYKIKVKTTLNRRQRRSQEQSVCSGDEQTTIKHQHFSGESEYTFQR
jgi:hypothetical protein